jgi:hypothetical protein
VIKAALGAVACILTWFFTGEVLSPEDSDQLLAVGAVGFGLAAVILP